MADNTPFLVINPSADAERLAKKTDEILNIAKDVLGDFEYEMTKNIGDGIPIGQKAIENGYKVIVAIGGDGTLNEIINVAAKTNVKVGMIPGGSANDSHKTHGVPEDFTRAFEIISDGYSEKFPVGLAKGDTERYFIEMINGAFIGQTSDALSDRFEHMHGELGYAYAAIHTAMRYKPIPSKITIDDKITREVNLSAFAVALTDTIADFEFIPSNHPRLDDFAIFIGRDLKRIRLVRLILKAYNGKHLKNKNVEILRGKKVVIESETPHIWESEGEIPSRNATKMDISYIPDAINLIIPKGWKYGINKKERSKAKKNVLKRKPPFES
jgi:YegS/Rv2252/BmrU family lipid kinase